MADGYSYWTGLMRKANVTGVSGAAGRNQFNWVDTVTGQLFDTQPTRESNTPPYGLWGYSTYPVWHLFVQDI